MQKIRKIHRAVSEISKDGQTINGPTDGQGRLLRTPSGKLGVQKEEKTITNFAIPNQPYPSKNQWVHSIYRDALKNPRGP